MKKYVVVINGKGGVGKDTLIEMVSKHFKVRNVSSVDGIKDIARSLGWDGQKDDKSRKFLADLKQLATDYNDYPFRYTCTELTEFLRNENQELMFVHIREGKEIQKFVDKVKKYKSYVDVQVDTLLVRRSTEKTTYGNKSDDNVDTYDYDYIYENELPLEKVEYDFLLFLLKMMTKK